MKCKQDPDDSAQLWLTLWVNRRSAKRSPEKKYIERVCSQPGCFDIELHCSARHIKIHEVLRDHDRVFLFRETYTKMFYILIGSVYSTV